MPGENSAPEIIKSAYNEIGVEVQESRNNQVIVLGDFNSKLKYQQTMESSSGKVMQEFIDNHNLDVLNQCSQCEGTWTRVEGNKKSIIDYVVASSSGLVEKMIIDEEKEMGVYYYKKENMAVRKIYSDHNAIHVKVNWEFARCQKRKIMKNKIMTAEGLKKIQNGSTRGEIK